MDSDLEADWVLWLNPLVCLNTLPVEEREGTPSYTSYPQLLL